MYLGSIFIFYLLLFCGIGSIWGIVTRNIIRNKGYKENWFWWGFLGGLIAVIVALTKPDISNRYSSTNVPVDMELENLKKIKAYKELLDMGAISAEEFEERKKILLIKSEDAEIIKKEIKDETKPEVNKTQRTGMKYGMFISGGIGLIGLFILWQSILGINVIRGHATNMWLFLFNHAVLNTEWFTLLNWIIVSAVLAVVCIVIFVVCFIKRNK